jgi:hypothetical protein
LKLLSTLLVLAVIGTTGAATALTYNRSGATTDAPVGRICTLSGYMMYCS